VLHRGVNAPLAESGDSVGQLRSGKAHSRSLGYARDDKGEGSASRGDGLLAERVAGRVAAAEIADLSIPQ
jgi:hypothetical protein